MGIKNIFAVLDRHYSCFRKIVYTYALVLGILISPTSVFGQVSLVPAHHQVYDWLHLQRVKGNISNYSYESLPLSRGQILTFLNRLSEIEGSLNGTDKKLLRWYQQEFSPEYISTENPISYLQGWQKNLKESAKSKVDLLLSNEEPHLYALRNDYLYTVFDYSFSGGGIFVNDQANDINEYSKLNNFIIRGYGTVYNTFGWHGEISNPLVDKAGLLRYHPEWGQTFDGRNAAKNSTFFAEAFFSVQYKQLGLHVGNGDLKYGFRGHEAQILRQDAGNFDWVRLNFDTKYLQYTLIHGALRSETSILEVDGYPGIVSRVSPERWFALRRIQLTPASWISMAFTESLIYSNRPVELSYVNPLLPLRFGEYETLDKDNPIWFFDGSIRPVNNLELYGTLGIDDILSLGDVFKGSSKRISNSGTVSYQAGFNLGLPSSTLINAEVLQIDPYFYSHWQFFNTYDELGSPLGASIGPNSRQFHISVRQWLPWRSFIDVSFQTVKKGFNEVDENGDLLLDVGGDMFQGIVSVNGDEVDLFAGEIHTWNNLNFELEFEPIRGIRLFGRYTHRTVNRGSQIDDLNLFYGGIEFNFYPAIPNILGVIPGPNLIF